MMWIILIAALVLVGLAYLAIQYSIFVQPSKGLPIVMYHGVSPLGETRSTVSVRQLEYHFHYFRSEGYSTIHFSEVKAHVENGTPLPSNPLIITFDDAYHNVYDLALPRLKRHNFKATVFVPVGYIGKRNAWADDREQLMDVNLLRECVDTGLVELGFHSYAHKSYESMSIEEIEDDVTRCTEEARESNLRFTGVMAYPYGRYPRKDASLNQRMKQVFKKHGIDFAVRIGSRINVLPLRDPYELSRIDVRGSDRPLEFRIKMKKGRRKLFG